MLESAPPYDGAGHPALTSRMSERSLREQSTSARHLGSVEERGPQCLTVPAFKELGREVRSPFFPFQGYRVGSRLSCQSTYCFVF